MEIDKVGITDLVLPLKIRGRNKKVQDITGRVEVLTNLSRKQRGTHMSRMVKLLNEFAEERVISYEEICLLLGDLQKFLDNKKVQINIQFILFRKKYAPISKIPSYVNYDCEITARKIDRDISIILGTKTLITSLCPISKSLSKASAHNQRGEVNVTAELINDNLWFEDLISIIENNSSCDLFGVLKRVDEKFVTEKAYDNAMIVEDIVRGVADNLKSNKNIKKWTVSCKNLESIHTHNAFAEITGKNGR